MLAFFHPFQLLHYSYMELELITCHNHFLFLRITLFLYGIGAFSIVVYKSIFNFLLHYSYMELELCYFQLCISLSKIITLFLYGIGAITIPCQKESYKVITLFLYGIGARFRIWNIRRRRWLHYSYMELELSVSNLNDLLSLLLHYSYMELEHTTFRWIFNLRDNYIIPIWNWSCIQAVFYLNTFVYYIIPIWNWSLCQLYWSKKDYV